MSDIDSAKCQYIGNLAAVDSTEYDRIVGSHSPWMPNLVSTLNKIFLGNACIYEVVRVLNTISIVVKRSPINAELLEKDLNSIYDYCLDDLKRVAEKHPKFMQKSPVKFYIYSPEQKLGEYKFFQMPVGESVFNEKFHSVMFECSFSVIFNDIGKFVRYQEPEQNMVYNIYNKPHNVFNDYSRCVQTPNYGTTTESELQKGFAPHQPSTLIPPPAYPSVVPLVQPAPSVPPPSGWNQPAPAAAPSVPPPSGWNQPAPAAAPSVPPPVWNQPAPVSAAPSSFNPSGWNQPAAAPSVPPPGWNQPAPVSAAPSVPPPVWNQPTFGKSLFGTQPAPTFGAQPPATSNPSIWNNSSWQPTSAPTSQPSVWNQPSLNNWQTTGGAQSSGWNHSNLFAPKPSCFQPQSSFSQFGLPKK